MNFSLLLLVLLSIFAFALATEKELSDESVLLVKRHMGGQFGRGGRGGPGGNCGGPSTGAPAAGTTTTARERVPGL